MNKPSNIELDAIAEHLFLFRPDSETRLPPVMHDAATENRFGAIVADSLFVDLGLAIVVHPPAGSSSAPATPAPQAFLWNEDDNWDIGSAGKLSLPLAALVLRHDVQKLLAAGLVSSTTSGDRLDALFHHVWRRHPSPAIAAFTAGGQTPRPSLVLDWSGSSVTIKGHVPRDDMDWVEMNRRSNDDRTVSFEDLARSTFHECLHMAIGRSDNAAARVCQGAVGVGFADAVIEKLGLFKWASPPLPKWAGTGMRVAGTYGHDTMEILPNGWPLPRAAPTRKVRAYPNVRQPTGPALAEKQPFVGTARSMATFMTALMTDRLLDAGLSSAFRDYLEVKYAFSRLGVTEYIDAADAALGRATDPNRRFFLKIGVLAAQTEVLHVMLRSNNYSVIALGLLNIKVNGRLATVKEREATLFRRIHTIIASSNP